MLHEVGAREIDLNVESASESAIISRHRFGFDVVTRTPTFALLLR